MAGVVCLVLSVLLGAGCAALGWSQVRRILGVMRADPVALTVALKKVPAPDRAHELQRRTEPGTWEHELAESALAVPGEDAGIAAVNRALADIDHALSQGARWPSTALRLSLMGAGLLAVAAFVADPGQVKWPAAILASGGVAALTCVEAGRSAERNLERQRKAIDALVAVAFEVAEGQAAPAVEPRGRRSRGLPHRRAPRG